MSNIKFVVDTQKLLDLADPDTLFYIGEAKDKEVYDLMVHFIVDEKGEYLTVPEARKLFKKIKYRDLTPIVVEFLKAINEAFVNPTNGGSSGSGDTKPGSLPDG